MVAAIQCCSRTQAIRSLAAVHGEYAAPPKNGSLYDENDYNETSSIENGQAYHLRKVILFCITHNAFDASALLLGFFVCLIVSIMTCERSLKLQKRTFNCQYLTWHTPQTLAEKEAWKFCKQHKIDLVTICPNFGKFLCWQAAKGMTRWALSKT